MPPIHKLEIKEIFRDAEISKRRLILNKQYLFTH